MNRNGIGSRRHKGHQVFSTFKGKVTHTVSARQLALAEMSTKGVTVRHAFAVTLDTCFHKPNKVG